MEKYTSKLNLVETQEAIKFVKDTFQKLLAKKLNLLRVSAPLFVLSYSGLNDGLSGAEKPISFKAKDVDDNLEIIHSLAKWKRMALAKYNLPVGSGLYTDMNAIRKDETLDFCHSLYVDQWDWEKVILEENRKLSYLKKVVRQIYACIYNLKNKVINKYPTIDVSLPKDIYFISTKALENKFPLLSRKEREDEITRLYGAVFVYQIGWNLKDKKPHDSRAADYDDWKLNGDILLYDKMHNMAFEISSMGIRVNKESLVKQLKSKNEEYKLQNDYCKSILNDSLPLSIGGGIGQSRLAMFMLQKAHIGEVQVSTWPKDEVERLRNNNIYLL